MRAILVILFILSSWLSIGQVPIDSAYALIKRVHVQSPVTYWPVIDDAFHSKLDSAKSDIDSVKCLKFVLERLEDVHSQIIYSNKIFSYYQQYPDSVLKVWGPLIAMSQQVTNHPKTELINDSILYVLVPGMNVVGDDIQAAGKALADSIDRFRNYNIKKIVLDYRLNGGGNVISMLAGLSRIYGDGILGYSVNYFNDVQRTISLRNGNVFMNDYALTNIDYSDYFDFSKTPVEVWIGPATMSSGTISAAMFRGRENAELVGEPTAAGYTTGNQFYAINNLYLNISVDYTRDRIGNVYRINVHPDRKVVFENSFDAPEMDIILSDDHTN
ncbi:MAG: S41 family peptidase [Flavobacteriales bacterium]